MPNKRGFYFFLRIDEILKLSTSEKDLEGAVLNSLNDDEGHLMEAIKYYLTKKEIYEAFKYYKRLAEIYYNQNILINERNSEKYYFIIICYLLFSVLLDNDDLLNEEFLDQYIDNYNGENNERCDNNFEILIALIKKAKYKIAKDKVSKMAFVNKNEQIDKRIILELSNLCCIKRKIFDKELVQQLETMLDMNPIPWGKIKKSIAQSDTTNKYLAAASFLCEKSPKPKKVNIENDGILPFLYAGHYQAALVTFPDNGVMTNEAKFLKNVLAKRVSENESEKNVSIDDILDIINLYNSYPIATWNIFDIIKYYFNVYFCNDSNKVYLANLILCAEYFSPLFSTHDLLFCLYVLKYNAYELLRKKYSIPTDPKMDNITELIIKSINGAQQSNIEHYKRKIKSARQNYISAETILFLHSIDRNPFNINTINLTDESPVQVYGPYFKKWKILVILKNILWI